MISHGYYYQLDDDKDINVVFPIEQMCELAESSPFSKIVCLLSRRLKSPVLSSTPDIDGAERNTDR